MASGTAGGLEAAAGQHRAGAGVDCQPVRQGRALVVGRKYALRGEGVGGLRRAMSHRKGIERPILATC